MYPVIIRFSDVAGFTFQGENKCKGCTAGILMSIMDSEGIPFPAGDSGNVHDLVWCFATLGRKEAIYARHEFDAYDVAAFDSGDVPKAFESGSVDDDETCDCGNAFV